MRTCLFLLLPFLLFAQTAVEKAAEKAYLANINTILIFTSEGGLSSGRYRFTKAGFKMDTYTVPYEHHFKPFNESMNWFFSGNAGYSVTKLDKDSQGFNSVSGLELTKDSKLQTYTAGAGGGFRYRSPWDIDFLVGAELIYSRVGTTLETKGSVDDAVGGFFNHKYNNNFTYKFRLDAQYVQEFDHYKPYVKLGFKLYETKSDFNFDALSTFSTQSDVTTLDFGVEVPAFLKYKHNYLSLEPYVQLNYLHGEITSVVKFDTYMKTGLTAYWNTPQTPSWIKRFFIDINSIRAEGLEGYNIGIGFNIDY